jgi:hypothetical protein
MHGGPDQHTMVDKEETGAVCLFDSLHVDRHALPVQLRGYIPQTLFRRWRPLRRARDVRRLHPPSPASSVRCRPIGMLAMEDERPAAMRRSSRFRRHAQLSSLYRFDSKRRSLFPKSSASKSAHFFAHIQGSRRRASGRCAIAGWTGPDEAMEEIVAVRAPLR